MNCLTYNKSKIIFNLIFNYQKRKTIIITMVCKIIDNNVKNRSIILYIIFEEYISKKPKDKIIKMYLL